MRSLCIAAICFLAILAPSATTAEEKPEQVQALWDKVIRTTQSTPTLQVVVNPPLRRGTKIHDNAFQSLKDTQADYVRYVPWLPYPRLGVAELEPPKDGKTSWDFTLIDPMTVDFLEATKGHSIILNFSTLPQWMYKTEKPVTYPADPNEPVWNYEQGTELRDPTGKEAGEYFARLLSWYTQGGFTDEFGKRHESGFHYAIPYWEILNEPEFEHQTTPETYTIIYDATVEAMRKVNPEMKFVGMALAIPGTQPQYFEYFLNAKNHKPGIPLDFISYHFYAVPSPDQSADVQQYTFFAQAEGFLTTVRYIESIRKRLSPGTRTTIDEIGAISAEDLAQGDPGYKFQPIPSSYWSLTSALYAYIFGELNLMGIDVVGESQLVGYPTQFPSVSMVDWETGLPNPRLSTLKLLRENFGPGDRIVQQPPDLYGHGHPFLYCMPVVTRDGKHRILLINKRNRPMTVTVKKATGARVDYVDQTAGLQSPATSTMSGDTLQLNGLAVAVITLR
jgi:hypothetical protein